DVARSAVQDEGLILQAVSVSKFASINKGQASGNERGFGAFHAVGLRFWTLTTTFVECPRCRGPILSWAARCPECGHDCSKRYRHQTAIVSAAAILAAVSLGAALPWI